MDLEPWHRRAPPRAARGHRGRARWLGAALVGLAVLTLVQHQGRPTLRVAAHLDPRYPRDEALAATDMMLAVALRHPSAAARRARGDGAGAAGTDLEEAQAALHNAQDRYAALAHARPDRRWQRHSLAALRELSE